jgi:hypothetical protein
LYLILVKKKKNFKRRSSRASNQESNDNLVDRYVTVIQLDDVALKISL